LHLFEVQWIYLIKRSKLVKSLKDGTDLLIKIKEVKHLLNGKTTTGHKAKYLSNFKNLRYAIILLASLVLPIDNTKEIQKLHLSTIIA
jgi:hypothetical protein